MNWPSLTPLRRLAAVALAALLLGCTFDTSPPAPGEPPGTSATNSPPATTGEVPPLADPIPTAKQPANAPLRGTRRLPFTDSERREAVNRTLDLIEKGGPFPYAQDGTVFQNRESRLPRRQRGHYHEYTVITPRLKNRGPRRLIVGQQAESETYYTDDHYKSFVGIDPRRYP